MKKYILILLTLLFIGFSYAQTEDKKEKTTEVVTFPQFKECANDKMSKKRTIYLFYKKLR